MHRVVSGWMVEWCWREIKFFNYNPFTVYIGIELECLAVGHKTHNAGLEATGNSIRGSLNIFDVALQAPRNTFTICFIL